GTKEIRLAVGFRAGKELGEGKEFPFIRNAEGMMALINGVGANNVGLLLDTWDWVVGDGAMDQISELSAQKITAVRLGGIPDDVDRGAAESPQRILPAADNAIDHVALVKHLETIGFEGPIGPTANLLQYSGKTRESIVQAGQEAVDAISKDAGLHVAPLPMDLIEDIPYEPTPMI
ncbi:MAG: TIM barrel protein, partial [Planctomycetota bacterium]